MNRGTRIERKLMEAEYLLDSTLSHVRKVRCGDIKPLALARLQKGTNAVRAAIQLIRNENRVRHPTLFAGSPSTGKDRGRGQKQKRWGSTVPHRWAKDCKEARP